MSTASTTVKTVNWNEVFANNADSVVDFAQGNLNFRDFKKSTSGTSRKEINKLEKHDASNRRTLARRACLRRGFSFTG